tara:strand:+ start:1660 stop:2010 length:351 start_codon:yes stop_codon:yes gene_type:complete
MSTIIVDTINTLYDASEQAHRTLTSNLTIWVTDEALGQWSAQARMTPDGQEKYSDLAITACLTLGVVYKLPMRQTQGLMRSIARLMRLEVQVPDSSTLSRRVLGADPSTETPSREN